MVVDSYLSPYGKTKEGNACIPQPRELFATPLNFNKEQRIHDRSKTAHRKPPVKCFLTLLNSGFHLVLLVFLFVCLFVF